MPGIPPLLRLGRQRFAYLFERQRCREVTVGVDLLLQHLDLLLGGADGIGPRDEAAGQFVLARECD